MKRFTNIEARTKTNRAFTGGSKVPIDKSEIAVDQEECKVDEAVNVE